MTYYSCNCRIYEHIFIKYPRTLLYIWKYIFKIKYVLSISDILNAVSDDKALVLFKTIALANYRSDSLRSKTKLTRKQFYSRISNLIRIGLVKRNNGKYSLTACGRVIYYVQE